MSALVWKRASLSIKTAEGIKRVEGERGAAFFIDRRDNSPNPWTLTHVPTGWWLNSYRTRASAITAATVIAPLANWRRKTVHGIFGSITARMEVFTLIRTMGVK